MTEALTYTAAVALSYATHKGMASQWTAYGAFFARFTRIALAQAIARYCMVKAAGWEAQGKAEVAARGKTVRLD